MSTVWPGFFVDRDREVPNTVFAERGLGLAAFSAFVIAERDALDVRGSTTDAAGAASRIG